MRILLAVLYTPWVYRRLPSSWRAYLTRRAFRLFAATMLATGASIEEAGQSLKRFVDAYRSIYSDRP